MTQDATFLHIPYGEYSKVEKPILVTMSYEKLDNEEENKAVLKVSQNNNGSNVVSDSNSDSNDKNHEIFFDEDVNKKVKVTPKTNINAKVVCVMKSCKLCTMTKTS